MSENSTESDNAVGRSHESTRARRVPANKHVNVAVLGAGLQGACIALELARRGVAVDLVEQDECALNRASLRNEGKIHLGFVYAKDDSLRTAAAMVEGALSFGPLLNRWTNGRFDAVPRSQPFAYLVARESLLTPEQLAEHYEAVQRLYSEHLARDGSADYLGERPERLWSTVRDGALRDVTSSRHIRAAFVTAEKAVDLVAMATLLRGAIADSKRIRFHARRRVRTVERTATGFSVEGTVLANGDAPWRVTCDQVVNALWDGRLSVDAGFGIRPEQAWCHRLKYRVLVDLPPALHDRASATFVLGAYGDVVVHPGGRGYVSWYPECMRGWSDALAVPEAWDAACRGEVPAADAAALAARVLGAADEWFPGLADARPFHVDAGTIFAFAETDITDPTSRLHHRDAMGVRSIDGYHTVNTGKLTTAPLFAIGAADAVTGRVHAAA